MSMQNTQNASLETSNKRLTLTLEVDYDLKGVDDRRLREKLKQLVLRAIENNELTDGLAVVDDYRYSVQDALDQQMEVMNVNLTVQDEEGNVVDGVTMPLSQAEISLIVDQAAQVALMRSDGCSGEKMDEALEALSEALQFAGVIEAPNPNEPRATEKNLGLRRSR